jgi:hypothetical protein
MFNASRTPIAAASARAPFSAKSTRSGPEPPGASGIPPGCNRITAREPVVVPPVTLERRTGYLLSTLRGGLAIGK